LLWLAALLFAPASSLAAGPLYRCGSTYQDRPCESVQQQEVVKPGRPGATPIPANVQGAAPVKASQAPVSPACAKLRDQRAHLEREYFSKESRKEVVRSFNDEWDKKLARSGC